MKTIRWKNQPLASMALICLLIYSCASKIQGDIIISEVNVIDVENGVVIPNQTIVIQENRIIEVKPFSKSDKYAANQVVNGKSKYVIPGLWDMHTHTLFTHFDSTSYHLGLSNKLMIANGVIGFRDMGLTYEASVKKFRDGIKNGTYMPQQFIYAGFMLDGDPPVWKRPETFATNNPDKAVHFIDSVMTHTGANFLKTYTLLPPDVFQAVSSFCNEKGIDFAGHYPIQNAPSVVVASGIKSLEHGYELIPFYSPRVDSLVQDGLSYPEYLSMFEDDSDSTAQIYFKQMKNNRVWMVPTLTINKGLVRYSATDSTQKVDERMKYAEWESWNGPPPPAHEFYKRSAALVERRIIAAHKAGVPFLAGTDTSYNNPFVFDGFSVHEELELLVACGFSPAEALKTATINPAKYLNATDSLGTVSKNKKADIVMLDENPLEAIKNTQKINAVITHGIYLNRTQLDSLLHDVETFYSTKRLN